MPRNGSRSPRGKGPGCLVRLIVRDLRRDARLTYLGERFGPRVVHRILRVAIRSRLVFRIRSRTHRDSLRLHAEGLGPDVLQAGNLRGHLLDAVEDRFLSAAETPSFHWMTDTWMMVFGVPKLFCAASHVAVRAERHQRYHEKNAESTSSSKRLLARSLGCCGQPLSTESLLFRDGSWTGSGTIRRKRPCDPR